MFTFSSFLILNYILYDNYLYSSTTLENMLMNNSCRNFLYLHDKWEMLRSSFLETQFTVTYIDSRLSR